MLASAQQGRAAGAVILRGGAWKPRSSSYACQGVGRPGLKLLARAREESGLLVCTEAMDPEGVRWVSEVADIVQIGARNMQNYSLLKAAGARRQPILPNPRPPATAPDPPLSAHHTLPPRHHHVTLPDRPTPR